MITTVKGEAQLVDRLYGNKLEYEDHYSEYGDEQRSLLHSLYNSQYNSDDEEDMSSNLKGKNSVSRRSVALMFVFIISVLLFTFVGVVLYEKEDEYIRNKIKNDNKEQVQTKKINSCELSSSHIHCRHNYTDITVQATSSGRWPSGLYW